MTSEQQRAVDRAIISGDLVDAVRLYRAATSTDLASAEAYVDQRNGSLSDGREPFGSAPFASASPSFSQALRNRADLHVSSSQNFSAFKGPGAWIIGCAVIAIVASALIPLVIGLGATGWALARTGLLSPGGILSQFTIVHEPYYGTVVSRIEAEPAFRKELGTPIAIDDGHVFCNYVSDTAVMQQANCKLPVSGPKATGVVQVRVQNRPDSLDIDMLLRIGDRVIRASS